MKTAVIYARYSCDKQTEQSIEGQLRVCQEYAQRNDILILNTYIDQAMSGTNDNRPDFQKMIKDSARKEWHYVLVYFCFQRVFFPAKIMLIIIISIYPIPFFNLSWQQFFSHITNIAHTEPVSDFFTKFAR